MTNKKSQDYILKLIKGKIILKPLTPKQLLKVKVNKK